MHAIAKCLCSSFLCIFDACTPWTSHGAMVHTLYRMFSPGTQYRPCEPLNQTGAVLMQSARARHDPPTARSTRFHMPCVGALSAPVCGLRLRENKQQQKIEEEKKKNKKELKQE